MTNGHRQMNKHKKNIEALRRHMGRDSAGLALMDDVARDLNEQRKRLALLEESESRTASLASHDRKSLGDALAKITQLQEELQREKSKRATAESRVALDAKESERIARMEADDEAMDANAPADDLFANQVTKLFNSVRRRYKRVPEKDNEVGGSYMTYDIDTLVKNFRGDEFMSLGMLVCFTALFHGKGTVISRRMISDLALPERTLMRMACWLKPRIDSDGVGDKVLGAFHRHPIVKEDSTPDTGWVWSKGTKVKENSTLDTRATARLMRIRDRK